MRYVIVAIALMSGCVPARSGKTILEVLQSTEAALAIETKARMIAENDLMDAQETIVRLRRQLRKCPCGEVE